MKFIYPIDIDATFSVDNGTITNNYRIHDGAIDFGATVANADRVQFDFDTADIPDSVAIYVVSGTGTAEILNSPTNQVIAPTAITAGWNVITVGSGSSQDWYVEFASVSSLVIGEIFFADEFSFPYRYDLGHTHQQLFGVDLKTSEGGGEFANKRHDEIFLRNWNSRSYSETNKTNYRTMLTAIGGIYAKLLWYDDSSYHWIRLSDIPAFREDTFESYSFGQGIRSQLQ